MGPASEPKANGSCRGPNSHESCVKTQFCWVRHEDPMFQGLKFLNIIICIINIVIFIIIKTINIKNSIICVTNIIIFIIINIINKIINKFEKNYYQY